MTSAHRLAYRPALTVLLAFGLSFVIYLGGLVVPYHLFAYAAHAPISMPEIAQRRPLPAAAFLLTFITLFALYALAYRTCCRYPSRGLARLVLLCGMGFALLLSLTYPVGAGDMVDYVSHGEELAYYRTNPLVVAPAALGDAVFSRYSAFRCATSNYGPLWVWISGLLVAVLGRNSLVTNLLGFKGVAIAAYLAQAISVYVILLRRNWASAPAGLVFLAWNPLVLYELAANGHNDGAMMALALLGVLFWALERPLAMVVALTCSLLIKVPTAPLLPIFLLAAARRRPGLASALVLAGGGVLAGLLVAVAYLSLPDPLPALTNLSARSGLFTHSLPAVVSLSLQMGGLTEAAAQSVVRVVALAGLGAWYLILLKRVWQKPGSAVECAYDFVLVLLLFATPWFQPWYVTWLVALAALGPHPQARAQAGLFSLTVVFSYVVYGFVWFWIPSAANWGHTLGITLMAVGTTYLAPWTYTAYLWWQARRHG